MGIRDIAGKLFKSLALGTAILGAGGRLWMFLTGWVLAGNTAFSFSGTFEVILFGGLIGLGAGAFYLILLKDRFKRRLLEGTFFGLGIFLALSFAPIEGKFAIETYDKQFWFPILLGYSFLFFLFGLYAVRALNERS